MEKLHHLTGTIVLCLGPANLRNVGHFQAVFACKLLAMSQTTLVQQSHPFYVKVPAILKYLRLIALNQLQHAVRVEKEIFERNVLHEFFACRSFNTRSLQGRILHLHVKFYLYLVAMVQNAAC
jgi:hypothetical protein